MDDDDRLSTGMNILFHFETIFGFNIIMKRFDITLLLSPPPGIIVY